MTIQTANPYESSKAADPHQFGGADVKPRPASRLRTFLTLATPFVVALLWLCPMIVHGPMREYVNRIQSKYLLLPYDWIDVLTDAAMSTLCIIIGTLQWWVVCRWRHQLIGALGMAYLGIIPLAVVLPALLKYVVFPALDIPIGEGFWIWPKQLLAIVIAAVLGEMGTCLRTIARHKASLP